MSNNYTLYSQLLEAKRKNHKKLAVLIDPDKLKLTHLDTILQKSVEAKVDYFFIGGSLIVYNQLDKVLNTIKETCDIPLILFPGNSFQLSYKADALLFLSLISGRNAELLIGKHVISAPYLKISPLEIMPTGYILIDGGIQTTVSYISNTMPIPRTKNDVALCTAMAGEMLGLKQIYMDAGSGAQHPIPADMIRTVSDGIDVPLIVGGGIRTVKQAKENLEAGADVLVIGTAFEKDPTLIHDIAAAVHSFNDTTIQV